MRIVNHLGPQDLLSVNGALPLGISAGAYNPATGFLTLTGSAPPGAYQTALRQIQYSNVSGNPNGFIQRIVRFEVNDGSNASNTLERGVNVSPTIMEPLSIPHIENFDSDGDGVRYTSNSFNFNNADYFERTDTNPHPGQAGGIYTFTAPQGGGYFAAEDVNDNDNPLGLSQPGIVRLPGLDSSGLGNLAVEIYLADLDNGTTFDGGEMFEVQAAFDADAGGTNLLGGSYTVIGRFIANSAGALQLDSNLDNSSNDPADASSPILTSTFAPHSFEILGSGNLLSVQVVVTNTSGNEEIAFDHVTVSGASVGDPPVLAAIEVAAASYTEGGGELQITNTITTADNDDTTLEGATIQITTGYQSSEDVLNVMGAFPLESPPRRSTRGRLRSFCRARHRWRPTRQHCGKLFTKIRTYSTRTCAIAPWCSKSAIRWSNSNLLSRDIQIVGVVAGVSSLPYLENFDTDGDGVRYTSTPSMIHRQSRRTTSSAPIATPIRAMPVWHISSRRLKAEVTGPRRTSPTPGTSWAITGLFVFPILTLQGWQGRTVSIYLRKPGLPSKRVTRSRCNMALTGDGGGTSLTSGSYTTIGRFIGNAGNLRQDTNLNGSSTDPADAASPELTPTMTEYTFNLPATGNVLSLQVKVTQDGGTENISFDHILVDAAPAGPEIDVQGQGMSIASGDVTPDTADDTNFGSVECAVDADVVHTFTILNTGAALTLSGGPNFVSLSGSSDFSVTQQPTSPVAASTGSTTFDITFSPSSAGAKTATVSISSDDADESPYTFAIAGTGTDTTRRPSP